MKNDPSYAESHDAGGRIPSMRTEYPHRDYRYEDQLADQLAKERHAFDQLLLALDIAIDRASDVEGERGETVRKIEAIRDQLENPLPKIISHAPPQLRAFLDKITSEPRRTP